MSNPSDVNLSVEVISNKQFMVEGMQFCANRYQTMYQTYWRSYPDVLFVARRSDQIVSTLGMELGIYHPHFGAERYFSLSPRMQSFLHEHRKHVGELGRFASQYQEGARLVFHAAIDYAYSHDLRYFIAWANPIVINHLHYTLGIPFWNLIVPVNRDAVEQDTQWIVPPREFFYRPDPPQLLFSVTAFWENVPYPIAPTEVAT